MPRWSAHTSGFGKPGWRSPAVSVRDAVATAGGVVATAPMTPLWDAGVTATESLMDAITALNLAGSRHFELQVDVADDPVFTTVTVSVTFRT